MKTLWRLYGCASSAKGELGDDRRPVGVLSSRPKSFRKLGLLLRFHFDSQRRCQNTSLLISLFYSMRCRNWTRVKVDVWHSNLQCRCKERNFSSRSNALRILQNINHPRWDFWRRLGFGVGFGAWQVNIHMDAFMGPLLKMQCLGNDVVPVTAAHFPTSKFPLLSGTFADDLWPVLLNMLNSSVTSSHTCRNKTA